MLCALAASAVCRQLGPLEGIILEPLLVCMEERAPGGAAVEHAHEGEHAQTLYRTVTFANNQWMNGDAAW